MTTPGPWAANNLIVSSVGKVPEPLALMALNGGRQDEAVANARLMAAAPELLAACKQAVKATDAYAQKEALDYLYAVIAKAEGK